MWKLFVSQNSQQSLDFQYPMRITYYITLFISIGEQQMKINMFKHRPKHDKQLVTRDSQKFRLLERKWTAFTL